MSDSISSDWLEQQFGPTRLEVLYQAGQERVICTKSSNQDQLLELSHVVFRQSGIKAFPDVHRAVLGGQSIGKAFRVAGIAFTRQLHAAAYLELPGSLASLYKIKGKPLVMFVTILIGDDKTPYADILETYTPQLAYKPYLASGFSDQATASLLRLDQVVGSLSLDKDI